MYKIHNLILNFISNFLFFFTTNLFKLLALSFTLFKIIWILEVWTAVIFTFLVIHKVTEERRNQTLSFFWIYCNLILSLLKRLIYFIYNFKSLLGHTLWRCPFILLIGTIFSIPHKIKFIPNLFYSLIIFNHWR